MLTKKTLITIFALFLIFCSTAYPQQEDPVSQIDIQSIGTPVQQRIESLEKLCKEKNLTAQQCEDLKTKVIRSEGLLTGEAIEQLKRRPEFKGLTPEEVLKGKELLEKRQLSEAEVKPTIKIEEIKSIFQRYRVIRPYQDISTKLKPFGYEFFSGAPVEKLTPRKDIPVVSDYVIGPGDEIKILLWGRVNAQYNLVVDRDGNITIPQIGPLQVAGMRFDQMKNYLTEQTEQIIGAKINVTMGTLKSVQVFVLGDVRRPGSYTLDSFSTITNALLAAGGPTEIGSLRSIRLKRNNKTIAVVDFYDLLLKGDKSQDKVLQSGDIVFVPTVGSLVGVAGNVKRPAIYELKDKLDLSSFLDLAGGIIPTAYTQQIQVERIQKNERQIVIDIDDKDLTKSKDFMLQDGDLVKVFSITDKDVNAVYLNGNVKRPGKYELKSGMKIKDLIKDPSDLLKETYFEYALIKRLNPPGLESQLIPFNLGKVLFDNDVINNIELQPQDMIYIFSRWFFKDKPYITVEGEVRKKGKFDLIENYKVKDAILEAGGLTKDASLQKGEIIRLNEQREVLQIYFNVGLAMAEDSKENVLLQDGDRIIIHSIWEKRYKHTVSIEGDVKNTGQYPLAKDMHISDLIFAAGNILESSYLDEAEVSSYIIDEGKSVRIDYRKINLRLALERDPAHDLALKSYDRVFVKRIPGWHEERFVTISGETNFPGRYIIKKGERLSSVIKRAGGFTDKAYLRGATFTRESVKSFQQQMLNEYINRLEKELLIKSGEEVTAALTSEDAKVRQEELKRKREFITKLRSIQAKGRMVIYLSPLEAFRGGKSDIELEDGDSLFIPQRPSSVNVIGAVYNQTSFLYDPEAKISHYIGQAGGTTENADKKRIYVLKVDGSAIPYDEIGSSGIRWNKRDYRWEVADYSKTGLDPGDTIVVPEKLEKIAWLRKIKDITQIMFQIAVTTGVVVALF